MPPRISDKQVAAELVEMLQPDHAGIEVEIGQHPRWQRRCVTFRWSGFSELLPEERFFHLVKSIPEDFRVEKLAGAVWLELTPGETVDQFLGYPRSEDVAEREPQIYRRMMRTHLFPALAGAMGTSPDKSCGGHFAETRAILTEKGWKDDEVREAKLVFIRHRAFCDCQVLTTAQAALAELHTDR
jgi:hypothetical protein